MINKLISLVEKPKLNLGLKRTITENNGSYRTEVIEGIIFRVFADSFYTVVDEWNEEVVVNHCSFTYSDIELVNGFVCGRSGSQVFILNEKGLPISNMCWEEEICESAIVPVGESDYFTEFGQKTFKKKITNRSGEAYLSIFKAFCIQESPEGKLSDILVLEQGSVLTIIDKENHKPIIKDHDVISFHEIYLKNGKWFGEKGSKVVELDNQGVPLEGVELCA